MASDPRVNVGVASVFLRDEGNGVEILLIHRRPDATHGGDTWAPPGGWIDYGQRPEEAAAREAEEEVRVFCKPQDAAYSFTASNTYPEQDKHIICLFYTFEEYNDASLTNVEPEKCDAVEWIPVTALREFQLFPPFRDFALATGWT